jgi:DNA-directed RNA polymerase specialized sigma subunit
MRYEQDLTLEQVARVLGLENAQAADRRIREVLQRLRKDVE